MMALLNWNTHAVYLLCDNIVCIRLFRNSVSKLAYFCLLNVVNFDSFVYVRNAKWSKYTTTGTNISHKKKLRFGLKNSNCHRRNVCTVRVSRKEIDRLNQIYERNPGMFVRRLYRDRRLSIHSIEQSHTSWTMSDLYSEYAWSIWLLSSFGIQFIPNRI